MAQRDVLRVPDPRLKRVCAPIDTIDDRVRALAADLVDTLDAVVGTGIAAPQIGELVRMVFLDAGRSPKHADGAHPPLVLLNPVIVDRSGSQRFREGCLSLPEFLGQVKRSKRVHVTALGLDGEPLELEFEGFEAVLVQHELDHLDGVLFVDRVENPASLLRRGDLG